MGDRNEIKAVLIGNFDGVHLGHIYLIKKLIYYSKERNLKPLLLILNPPSSYVLGKTDCLMSTFEEKKELINKNFAVGVEELPFSKEVAQMPPDEFIEQILEQYNVKFILSGYDWKFGKDRKGDINLLKEICKKRGCEVVLEKAYKINGINISSSFIRNLLKKAQIKTAEKFLGHPYWIRRKIVKGKGLASKLGFPTLNFEEVELLCLPNGVYLVLCDGYPGIANLGYAPTLRGEKRLLEVHILVPNFEISERPQIVFINFLREELSFKSIYQLQHQIKRDVKKAKEMFIMR